MVSIIVREDRAYDGTDDCCGNRLKNGAWGNEKGR